VAAGRGLAGDGVSVIPRAADVEVIVGGVSLLGAVGGGTFAVISMAIAASEVGVGREVPVGAQAAVRQAIHDRTNRCLTENDVSMSVGVTL